jgi:hypothetical protein
VAQLVEHARSGGPRAADKKIPKIPHAKR